MCGGDGRASLLVAAVESHIVGVFGDQGVASVGIAAGPCLVQPVQLLFAAVLVGGLGGGGGADGEVPQFGTAKSVGLVKSGAHRCLTAARSTSRHHPAGARESSIRAVLTHAAVAERLELGSADHKALDLLDRLGSLTAGELATHTGLTSSAITGIADRSERAGHPQCVRDPEDRRRVILERAHGGKPKLGAVFGALTAHTEALLDRYDKVELRVILDFLQRASVLAATEHRPSDQT